MVGQEAPVTDLAPVIAWVAAAALTFGPGAIGVTKLVDALRSFDATDSWPKWTWIASAFVIGIGACVAFEINVVGGLLSQVPAFLGSTVLDGMWGQVVTGVALAGTASYHHERMDRASSEAKAAVVVVEDTTP